MKSYKLGYKNNFKIASQTHNRFSYVLVCVFSSSITLLIQKYHCILLDDVKMIKETQVCITTIDAKNTNIP